MSNATTIRIERPKLHQVQLGLELSLCVVFGLCSAYFAFGPDQAHPFVGWIELLIFFCKVFFGLLLAIGGGFVLFAVWRWRLPRLIQEIVCKEIAHSVGWHACVIVTPLQVVLRHSQIFSGGLFRPPRALS